MAAKKETFSFTFRVFEDGSHKIGPWPGRTDIFCQMISDIARIGVAYYMGQMADGNMVAEEDKKGNRTGRYFYQPPTPEEISRMVTPAKVPIIGLDGKAIN